MAQQLLSPSRLPIPDEQRQVLEARMQGLPLPPEEIGQLLTSQTDDSRGVIYIDHDSDQPLESEASMDADKSPAGAAVAAVSSAAAQQSERKRRKPDHPTFIDTNDAANKKKQKSSGSDSQHANSRSGIADISAAGSPQEGAGSGRNSTFAGVGAGGRVSATMSASSAVQPAPSPSAAKPPVHPPSAASPAPAPTVGGILMPAGTATSPAVLAPVVPPSARTPPALPRGSLGTDSPGNSLDGQAGTSASQAARNASPSGGVTTIGFHANAPAAPAPVLPPVASVAAGAALAAAGGTARPTPPRAGATAGEQAAAATASAVVPSPGRAAGVPPPAKPTKSAPLTGKAAITAYLKPSATAASGGGGAPAGTSVGGGEDQNMDGVMAAPSPPDPLPAAASPATASVTTTGRNTPAGSVGAGSTVSSSSTAAASIAAAGASSATSAASSSSSSAGPLAVSAFSTVMLSSTAPSPQSLLIGGADSVGSAAAPSIASLPSTSAASSSAASSSSSSPSGSAASSADQQRLAAENARLASENAKIRQEYMNLKNEATRRLQEIEKERDRTAKEAGEAIKLERESAARKQQEWDSGQRTRAQALARVLRESAAAQAVAEKRVILEQHARLGRYVVVRGHVGSMQGGSSVQEAWEDGEEFQALHAQAAALHAKLQSLEARHKELTSKLRKRSKKAAGAAGAGSGAGAKSGKSKRKSAASSGGDDEDGDDDETGASAAVGSGESADTYSLNDPFGLGAPSPSSITTTLGIGAGAGASASSSSSSSSSAASNPAEFFGDLELQSSIDGVKMAIATVLKDQLAIQEKQRALTMQKTAFQFELRRMRAERESRFRNYPTLGSDGRYLLLSLLGKGGFSEVWRAMDLWEVKEVAVKVHQLSPHWHEEKKKSYVTHAMREFQIQSHLKHQNVVRLLAAIEMDADSFATILEYCKGTDLDRMLKQYGSFPEKEAKAILTQLLSALLYLNGYSAPESVDDAAAASASSAGGAASGAGAMAPPPNRAHGLKIIHYDLKPGNILFDEFRTAKVTDFGLSKILESAESGDTDGVSSMELTSQGAGTYWYLPPECFDSGPNKPRISNRVDVWSVGVIFYQMLYGKRPFNEGVSQEQILTQNLMSMHNLRDVQFPSDVVVSDGAKRFIQRCLTRSVIERPDVYSICQDPYLRQKTK